MRAVILAFACGIALATASAQAASLPPKNPPGPVVYIPNLEWTPLPNDAPSPPPLAPRGPVELVAGVIRSCAC